MPRTETDPVELKGLPQAIDTEKLILAGILHGDLDYRDCSGTLSADDLALESHRLIYRMIGDLTDRGSGIDSVTLCQALMDAGSIEAAGGLSYVVSLDDGMPHIAHYEDYIRSVRDKSILRRAVLLADRIRSEAILGGQSAPELIGRAEAMLRDLGMESARSSEFRQPGEIIRARGGLGKYLDRGKEAGVPTGFPRFDEMTCGVRPGQLWILAAATSGGKSTFARQVALNAALRTYPGAIITLEMTEDEVTDGLICQAGEINTQIIRRGMMFDRDKVRSAAHKIADLPIYIRDQAGATIPKIHSELRRLKAEKGIQWAIVDYLQLMTPFGRFGSRAEEVGHLSRGLKLIAHELKIGLVVLSQLSRGHLQQKRRPELSDLRESGSIENDANVVIFLYSEWQASPMELYPTELIIAKQRGGPIGSIPFGFKKSTGQFFEHSEGMEAVA